ncbi:MAG: hypothetical protein ACKV19_27065 [Verrucomicrobiales bacterium]
MNEEDIFAVAEAEMKPLPAEGQPFKERAENDDLFLWLANKEARSLLQPVK